MAEKIHVRCGKLFQGTDEKVLENHTIVAEAGIVTRIAPTKDVPKLAADAKEYGIIDQIIENRQGLPLPA